MATIYGEKIDNSVTVDITSPDGSLTITGSGVGGGGGGGGGDSWATIYARTTDPNVAGTPWNDGGFVVFSAGGLVGTWVIQSGAWGDSGTWNDSQTWTE